MTENAESNLSNVASFLAIDQARISLDEWGWMDEEARRQAIAAADALFLKREVLKELIRRASSAELVSVLDPEAAEDIAMGEFFERMGAEHGKQ